LGMAQRPLVKYRFADRQLVGHERIMKNVTDQGPM
jgi:hypothetical protein